MCSVFGVSIRASPTQIFGIRPIRTWLLFRMTAWSVFLAIGAERIYERRLKPVRARSINRSWKRSSVNMRPLAGSIGPRSRILSGQSAKSGRVSGTSPGMK